MRGTWIRQPSGDTTVVFVHGILSAGIECWSDTTHGSYWPHIVRDDAQLQDVGIYVYDYLTGIDSSRYSIRDAGDDLFTRMQLDGVDSQRLAFVCHSMGGIVVRKCLIDHQTALIDGGGRLFCCSSHPHRLDRNGRRAFCRFLGWWATNRPQPSRVSSAEGDFLETVDRDFLNLKESRRLPITGRELIEDRPLIGRRLWTRLWTPPVVEPLSGRRYFGDPFKVPGSDHSTIAKPTSERADQHRLLRQLLTRSRRTNAELAFLSSAAARIGQREADDVGDVMRGFASGQVVDAYNQLRTAVDHGLDGDIETSRGAYEAAVWEDPESAAVLGKTLSEIQRVDPFAVIRAVVDDMFAVLTSADLTPIREHPPGCGAFAGSFSNPDFVTVVDFRRYDGSMKPPSATDGALEFTGLSSSGYNAEMWVLRAPEGGSPEDLADDLNARLWSTRKPITNGGVSYEIRKHADPVWIVWKIQRDKVVVVYHDPELRAAREAAGDDVAASLKTHFLETEATRRASEEASMFFIEDAAGVRELIDSIEMVRELRRKTVAEKNKDWVGAVRKLARDP